MADLGFGRRGRAREGLEACWTMRQLRVRARARKIDRVVTRGDAARQLKQRHLGSPLRIKQGGAVLPVRHDVRARRVPRPPAAEIALPGGVFNERQRYPGARDALRLEDLDALRNAVDLAPGFSALAQHFQERGNIIAAGGCS